MLSSFKTSTIFLIVFGLFCSLTAYGQPVVSADPHFKITSWTSDDGLPGNVCVKLFQDKDGFLWMGGFDGLVRFDGTRFILYNKSNQLTSNFAVAIVGDKEGNVWIGTDHGVVQYSKGTITDLSDKDHTFFVESLFFDTDEKKLWVGSRNAGLYTYDLTTRQYAYIKGIEKDDIINDILKDSDGSFWVGSEKKGLLHYKGGEWVLPKGNGGLQSKEIESLKFDDEGMLYVGTTSGLFKVARDGRFSEVEKFKGIRINKVNRDTKGNLWIGTVNGLYYEIAKDDWRLLTRKEGLSNNDIRDIFFDEDGSIWLGTYRGGVNQLRETKFATYFSKNGKYIEAVGAVCQWDENKLLIGTTEGKLFTLQDRVIKDYPVQTPLRQRIYTLLRDNKKNLWAASYDGLLLITPDGREKLFTEKDGLLTNQIRIIFQDRQNNYWIGTRNAGLIKMTFSSAQLKPRFEQFKHEELSKVNSTFIMGIDEDSNNNLLLCTNNGGITIISPQGTITNYNKKDGLESNTCFAIKEDKEGAIWITTTDGLTRLKNGKLFTFNRKSGMPVENPMDVLEDNMGFLWLPTQNGTIRVNKQQLNDFADQKIKTIDWKLFDKNNDLEKSECTGTAHSLITAKGTIWFPMINDLMSVEPSEIQISTKPPKIYFEKVTIDENEADITKPIVVEQGSKRVAFSYLALALLYPNSAQYKYRLTGYDKDWIDAGTSRQAVYTSIPYGRYTFSVMARSSDSQWSIVNQPLSVIVLPHFYQTWWFISLAILALSSGVFAYIRIRTNSIKQRSAYLERLINERTKLIAQQRDELVALNEELRSSQEEVLAQRDALAGKIEELDKKNDEIEQINANLEEIVEQRTKVLEDQNKRISEYAFINAHNLRGPLASILGLINLISQETDYENRVALNKHLLKSAEALDEVVRSINRMLEKEFTDRSGTEKDSSPSNKNQTR